MHFAKIDLNADLGEGVGNDDEMMRYISSANIACGGHAGDDDTIQHAIDQALSNQVTIGAHPGFEDKENFGRVRLDLEANELVDQVTRQLTRFEQWAAQAGTTTKYVKLHGALANMTAEDEALANVALGAVKAFSPNMTILALANSMQSKIGRELGLPVIDEAFADRAYTRDGQLASRALAGAVLSDEQQVLDHVSKLLKTGRIDTIEGEQIALNARSICLHGDNPHALALAERIRNLVIDCQVEISAFA